MSIPDRLGDFRIVEEIGRGGFGVVYRAEQVSLDRPVALKVLYQHKVHTADEVARFEREARAAARLDHPGIVSVFAWGQDGGDFFIAQKLVGEGLTIADELAVLKDAGEPPKGYFRRAALWLAVVAEALQHAHERGIVHRDVKPSNILLDENDRPFLGDFGLAKVEDGLELSRTGDFAGSPFYMSPEQADSRRGDVDHRSDIYALGVTLYELLTQGPPFQGQSSHEIIRKILTEDPTRPTKINPRVPADLETICLKAMEKGRVHRYQSAEAFAHDLRCFLDGEPINAAPPSAVSRVMRSARRHRTKVGMTLLSVVVVIMAVLSWQSRDRNTQSANQAKEATQAANEAKVAQQTIQSREATIDGLNLKGEDGASLDDAIDQAIADEDIGQVRELRARRKAVREFLESGSQLLLDVLPDITDSEALQDIGSAMKDQFLFGGLAQAQKILEEQAPEGDAEQDSRLEQVNSWLGDLNTELEGFDLSEFGIVTPGIEHQGEFATANTKGIAVMPPVAPSMDRQPDVSYQQFLEGLQPEILRANPWILRPLLEARLRESTGQASGAPSPAETGS
jgi:serine/threonine protein kinase